MKRQTILALFCVALVTGSLAPRTVGARTEHMPSPPPADPELEVLPISSQLFYFAKKVDAEHLTGNDLVAAAKLLDLLVLNSSKINVEIVNRRTDVPVAERLIRSIGGEIDAIWRGQVSAWIPPDRAIDLARILPAGYYLRRAHLAHNNNQGPATVRSDTYRDAGADGTGIIIGIIDRNFVNLTAAENQGVVPIATRHDYGSGGFESGHSVHGVAHLETVFDHAPGGTYHLFRINSSTHLGQAVDDAIALGVNILSATQSFYNEGWEDNSGAANEAVIAASDAGILYFSSSGNRAESHWQGMFDDPTETGWLDWAPGHVFNELSAIPDSGRVDLYLQWDRYDDGPNLDLYLYDFDNNLLALSNSNSNNFETINWFNNTGGSIQVKIAVIMGWGIPVELEVFNRSSSGRFQFATAASSITSPNTNTAINCLAVGAVPYTTYSDGNITDYSSRGPTNSGNTGIDIVGPTNTTTWVYPAGFSGTSCSTPNTAGATAAFWSSQLGFSADGIRLLIRHQASLYNDWGTEGLDPVYGNGGLLFYPFADNLVWMDRSSFNYDGLTSLPWYYIQDAVENSADNDCLLFMGGVFNEPIEIGEPRVLRSVVESAHIGGL